MIKVALYQERSNPGRLGPWRNPSTPCNRTLAKISLNENKLSPYRTVFILPNSLNATNHANLMVPGFRRAQLRRKTCSVTYCRILAHSFQREHLLAYLLP